MDVVTKENRRVNVTFPVGVLDALDDIVPARQRNRFIVEATEHALQRALLARVLEELRAKPAWSDDDHPNLRTIEDVDRFVRTMRAGWMDRASSSDEMDADPNG